MPFRGRILKRPVDIYLGIFVSDAAIIETQPTGDNDKLSLFLIKFLSDNYIGKHSTLINTSMHRAAYLIQNTRTD